MGNIGCKSCGDCMRRDKQSEFDDQKIQSLPTPRDQVIEKKSHYKQELQATDFSPVSGKGAESQARESTECSLYTRESFDCQSQKQKYNKTNKQGLFNINGRANTQSTQSRKQSQRDIKQEFKLTTEYTSNSKFSKNLIKDQSGFGRKFSAQEHQQQRKVNNLEFNGILNSNRYEDQNPYYFQKRLRIKKQQDNFSNILQALQQSDLYIKSIIKIQAWYRMINVRVKYIQKLNKINKQLTPSSGLTKHGQQSSYSHITEFKAYSSTHRDKNQFKKGSSNLNVHESHDDLFNVLHKIDSQLMKISGINMIQPVNTSAPTHSSKKKINNFKFEDGSVYRGLIDSFDQPHDHGRLVYPDGSSYQGQFEHGKFQGYGIFNFANNEKFEGWWIQGKQQGYGVQITQFNQKQYGYWQNGKQIRQFTSQDLLQISNDLDQVQDLIAKKRSELSLKTLAPQQ